MQIPSRAARVWKRCRRPRASDITQQTAAIFGPLGEPLVIIGIFEHCALGFEIVYLLCESASFSSSVEPVLGIVN
jgi:hypothetical protein